MNELKAMAILEAVHSEEFVRRRCPRRCDGQIIEVDTPLRVGLHEGWLEEYCLAFAIDAAGTTSTHIPGDIFAGVLIPTFPADGLTSKRSQSSMLLLRHHLVGAYCGGRSRH